ncbi:hypothetical protein B0H17DRAFT_1332268 [Mycena rosella]|uniref:Extracellular membrane protein CFEM domain-containing protein n=1 Tax=Mycena rosella TaxID=1033263 RepID=A0AAD7DBQ2_MYCRO|nr:hypothetical protein B0H17DRAFT_1332268 [Mycena rosella]
MYSTPITLFVGFTFLVTPTYTFQISTSGNITNVIPQCQDVCDTYDQLVGTCEKTPAQGVNFEQCECTDDNFKIIDACFNCQADASGTDQLQDILDGIASDCNNKVFQVAGTIAPQPIVASTFALTGNTGDPAISTVNVKSTGGASATAGSSAPSSTGGASSSSNDASRVKRGLLYSLAIGGVVDADWRSKISDRPRSVLTQRMDPHNLEPPLHLAEECAKAGVAAGALGVCAIGETVSIEVEGSA